MLIRCEDCFNSGKEQLRPWARFVTLPIHYWKPGGAVGYWLTVHGHIPECYTFRCEICRESMQSGPAIARENGWDAIMLAQNDWGFWQEHAHGIVSLS